LAAVVLFGACGGGDGAATSITVGSTEFAFTPDSWTIAADTDVSVTLTNEGTLSHEWIVLTAGTNITSESEFTEQLLEMAVEVVPPGDSGSITLNLAAGTYQVICALEGHFNGGMEGTLTVSAG